jgi:hypothetical protein
MAVAAEIEHTVTDQFFEHEYRLSKAILTRAD